MSRHPHFHDFEREVHVREIARTDVAEKDNGIREVTRSSHAGLENALFWSVSEVIMMVHFLSRNPSINRNISRRRSASLPNRSSKSEIGSITTRVALISLIRFGSSFLIRLFARLKSVRSGLEDVEGLVPVRFHLPVFLFHIQDQPVLAFLETDVDYPFPGLEPLPDKIEGKCCLFRLHAYR